MKDWSGNGNSIFKIISASNHSDDEREENDFYATDPVAIDKLYQTGELTCKNIWECACGEGHLAKKLVEYGYNVKATDLIDRGYGEGGMDLSDYKAIQDYVLGKDGGVIIDFENMSVVTPDDRPWWIRFKNDEVEDDLWN